MTITINGKATEVLDALVEMNLLLFLREELRLTGAKIGCGKGFCGTCTILIDNKPVKSCQKKVLDVADKWITTIEGMAEPDGTLHPLQQAFIDAGAIQCGYCTPGMVLIGHAFLLKNPSPSRNDIRKAISPNLCRCTGYQQIIDAVEAAVGCYK
ncbi:xanthine dehydrogenase [candidate division LCP-89 bacterium B3_LCP]|uniref:Xanthine dehydrogenase n=1 Tax=candidate division LCP-89 bacterium B3_LCP TaxID=2012998 RepID=A0A532US37_UNCL8|nr:MAG: xanthine dehydrogenase [candidate division LCP-89 bacterium B3_LCP]